MVKVRTAQRMETRVCSYHAAQLHQQQAVAKILSLPLCCIPIPTLTRQSLASTTLRPGILFCNRYQVACVKKPIGKLMSVAFKGKTHGKFALLHDEQIRPLVWKQLQRQRKLPQPRRPIFHAMAAQFVNLGQ